MELEFFVSDFLKASKQAALACNKWIGRGDKIAADDAATTAMRTVLRKGHLNCEIIVGEGELDEAPMLYIGEKFNNKTDLPLLDVAVDPLEGTNLCAKAMPGAMTVIAFANQGSILRCPEVYMEKFVVSPEFSDADLDIDYPLEKNLLNLAEEKCCKISDLRIVMLERDRHKDLLAKIRILGAKAILISDGDVGAVLSVLMGINDLYIGSGGSPEGILSAIAVKTFKGKMQARLLFNTEIEKEKAAKFGITNLNKKYSVNDMIKGDGYFIASGVTKGEILEGVSYSNGLYEINSLILSTKNNEMQMITSSVVA
jgi:fructose-1,6-bisphosphatase class II